MREFCARCIMSKKEKGVMRFVEEIMFNHVKAKNAEIAKKVMERQATNYMKGQPNRINQYHILDIEEFVEGTIISRAIKQVCGIVGVQLPQLPAPTTTTPAKPARLDMFRGLGKPTCRFTDLFKLATIDKYVKPEHVPVFHYTPAPSWDGSDYMGGYGMDDWDEDWDDWRKPGVGQQMCD